MIDWCLREAFPRNRLWLFLKVSCLVPDPLLQCQSSNCSKEEAATPVTTGMSPTELFSVQNESYCIDPHRATL